MYVLPLAQLVGLLATTVSVSSVTLKCDRMLRRVAAVGQFTWMIHFWMLGARTTAVLAALMCVRQCSSGMFEHHRCAVQRATAGGFYLAFTVATALTWQGWLSLLPWTIAMLANFAYSSLVGAPMRRALRGADCAGLANSTIIGSIGGVLAASLSIVLNTLTLRRLERTAIPAALAAPR